jgi:hypothetical protein
MYDNGQMVPQGDDAKLLVKFYKKAVQNNARSTVEGRPVFDELVYISIMAPGDKNNVIDRKARDEDKVRFPFAWQRYENNATMAQTGTPIEEWPRVSVSQAAELKAMNITTVEQLAGLADTACQKMMGLQALRTEAQAFIAAAKDASHAQRLAAELEKRDEKIAEQAETIASLAARLDALEQRGAKREKAAA